MELNEATKRLVEQYRIWQDMQQPQQGATIHVDEVALKISAFYEQLRTIVDWKEEHLMRRASIIRKLKRRYINLETQDIEHDEDAAESLVMELIRGGLFPNGKIEESKIKDVQEIIEKYAFILKNNPENQRAQAGLHFYNWLIEVMACEIEETLSPSIKEMALIEYMFTMMQERIKVSEKMYDSGKLKKEDTEIQIYIAVCQALFKLDTPIISYNILKLRYHDYQHASKELVQEISNRIFSIYEYIQKQLDNPVAAKFYSICEKYDTPYLLLGDVLDGGADEKDIEDASSLESQVKSAYSKRLATLKARIARAAIYSTVSIFISKILTLVLLEVVVSEIFSGKIDGNILILDVLIPTALMFLLVSSIKKPSKKNVNLVVMETMKIVYKKDVADAYEIKRKKTKSVLMRSILAGMYAVSNVFSFGAIYFVFRYFGFPVSSIIIDTVFIALILFTGTAIGKRAQELTMEDQGNGFLAFALDVFFLPIAGMGRWMSNKWKKYNAITAFFNALIDTPFSVFVEFFEKWRYFIEERKEEMR